MMVLIDRRKNSGGKSVINRNRFIQRTRNAIKESLKKQKNNLADFNSKNKEDKVKISIDKNTIHEPSFHLNPESGNHRYILPGNKHHDPLQYIEGDLIPKPPQGQGSGGGGSPDGEGVDEFRFVLTNDELNELYFEDLELPNEEDKQLKVSDTFTWQRAGYTIDGAPSNISLLRTMKNSLGRRIALNRPKQAEIEILETLIKADPPNREELEERLAKINSRRKSIPYIDTYDVRYNHFIQMPHPATSSVMFCLMDCSGSMSEEMKDLAKRFYILLYRFLTTKYKHVDVVFIRHTHIAKECDEETFFYDPESGGTVVSTALEEMKRIISERYDPKDWNIYVAQASDGDNYSGDNPITAKLWEELMPKIQYTAYIEIAQNGEWVKSSETDLWQIYSTFNFGTKFAMKKVKYKKDIYPVFIELFKKRAQE